MDAGTRELIITRYGLSADAVLSGPIERGYQGEVWRLTSGPDVLAVKRSLVDLSADQARLAYAFQQRAVAAGVAAPRQHRCVDGAIMIDTPGGGMIRVFDWVEMAAPQRDLDPAAVGQTLAQLHRAGGPTDQPYHPWYCDPVGEPRWRELLREWTWRRGPYAQDLAALLPTLRVLEGWLREPDPPYLIGHRDLWADNIRRWSGPGLLVIDWDNCGAIDPSQELAMVMSEFGIDRARAAVLHDAYRAAGGPGRITRPEDFSMTIAALGHILELGILQWLEATTETDRERAAGRVQEWVENPLRPEQIRDLVDGCTNP